jgi:hypothetical protein
MRDNTPSTSLITEGADHPLLTRRQLVRYVREQFGVPLTESRFNKDRMSGFAPCPDCFMGRLELFMPRTAAAYGHSLLSPTRRKLTGSRSGRLDETADRGAGQ